MTLTVTLAGHAAGDGRGQHLGACGTPSGELVTGPLAAVALQLVTRSSGLPTVLGTVAFTTVAGVVFSGLRDLSGSLLAPAGLHWATNALGVLASARVWAVSRWSPPVPS